LLCNEKKQNNVNNVLKDIREKRMSVTIAFREKSVLRRTILQGYPWVSADIRDSTDYSKRISIEQRISLFILKRTDQFFKRILEKISNASV